MAMHKSTAKRKASTTKAASRKSTPRKMGIFQKILTAEGWRRLLSRKKTAKKR
jgi:hypothetical protein